jgi:hypothetical protein
MFAYINVFGHQITTIDAMDYSDVLKYKGWGNPDKKTLFSPLDVLKNPALYESDMKRIKRANLSFPIIIHNGNIVDGVHRLTKAFLKNKKNLDAYIFDDNLMKKFLISNKGDWNKVDSMNTHDFIVKFYENFR